MSRSICNFQFEKQVFVSKEPNLELSLGLHHINRLAFWSSLHACH